MKDEEDTVAVARLGDQTRGGWGAQKSDVDAECGGNGDPHFPKFGFAATYPFVNCHVFAAAFLEEDQNEYTSRFRSAQVHKGNRGKPFLL